MRQWLIICSVDADKIDYETMLFCDEEPDFWTCYEIAQAYGCVFFDVTELT